MFALCMPLFHLLFHPSDSVKHVEVSFCSFFLFYLHPVSRGGGVSLSRCMLTFSNVRFRLSEEGGGGIL